MTYKVIDIEGVGDAYAVKLNEAGIKTVDELPKDVRIWPKPPAFHRS